MSKSKQSKPSDRSEPPRKIDTETGGDKKKPPPITLNPGTFVAQDEKKKKKSEGSEPI